MCVLPLNFFKVTYFSLDINVPTAHSKSFNECKQLLCKIFCWNSPNFTVCFHDCFSVLKCWIALIDWFASDELKGCISGYRDPTLVECRGGLQEGNAPKLRFFIPVCSDVACNFNMHCRFIWKLIDNFLKRIHF